MTLALEIVFWLSAGSLVYAYVGYPLLLALVAAVSQLRSDAAYLMRRADRRPAGAGRQALHEVAVVMSALNEEVCIEARLRNLLEQDYPAEKLRIYVGSDGSTDETAAIVRRVASEAGGDRVRLLEYPQRRGKASVLNDLVAETEEPLLLFTDANTMFDRDAVSRLARHFEDPALGAVCGELTIVTAGATNQDSLYWRIERLLKFLEARIGGLLGANGAIYALRRDLYRPLPADTVVDDFVVVMNAACAGSKVKYDPEARAHEDAPPALEDEFRRRVRIGVGNYQAFFRYPEYLTRGGLARSFAYFSHKVLRWFGPVFMLLAFAASAALLDVALYQGLFLLQIAVYLVALLVVAYGRQRRVPRLLRALTYVLTLNAAFAVALAKYATGGGQGAWRRTERESRVEAVPDEAER